jgi:hypothetical protein
MRENAVGKIMQRVESYSTKENYTPISEEEKEIQFDLKYPKPLMVIIPEVEKAGIEQLMLPKIEKDEV